MTLRFPSAVRRALLFALLGSVLIVHFATRWYGHQNFPLEARHNYNSNYEFSLSLIAGEGLRALGDLQSPKAAPLQEFLEGKRAELSSEEVERSIRALKATKDRQGIENHLASTRILDLYVAAGLWKLFGVSWDTLYFFYCLVSSASCGLVFLIARRLGESFWPGLLAAALYCISPLQSLLATLSLRDCSPLWFAAVGLYLLICVTDRFRRRLVNGLSFVALGAIAVVGLGWRFDAVLLVPVLGAGLVLVLVSKRRRWYYVLAALALFLAGGGGVLTGIDALCNFQRLKVSTASHMAYYGENVRCNLCGLENSFQIELCDVQTYFDACRLAWVVEGKPKTHPAWCSPEHFQKCKEMYLAALRYNLFNYVCYLPAFFWHVQDGLTEPALVQGVERVTLSLLVPPWAAKAHRMICEPLLNLLPWFVVLGAVAALVSGRQVVACLCLMGFEVFYTVVLFFILPMQKHLAVTLLPVSVFAGLGMWALLRLCRLRAWQGALPLLRGRRMRHCLVGAGLVAGLAALVGVGAYFLSVHERGEYLRAVEELASVGSLAPETLKNKQLFSVRIPPAADLPMTGYLLEMRTGNQPGLLECRHVHHPTLNYWGKISWTQHRLQANCTQYFFLTCRDGAMLGDNRPYLCAVSASGTAEIVASTRVDLSHWDRLPFCTVFRPGEQQAGSPEVGSPSSGGEFSCLPVSGRSPLVPKGRSYRGLLHHLIARNLDTGDWRFALSKWCEFEVISLGNWDAGISWNKESLLGDFDGDGLVDVAGLVPGTGAWVVARCDGVKQINEFWGAAKANISWGDLAVGDFNGDGFDDIFLRDPHTGDLVVALSSGKEFIKVKWGQWSPSICWQHVRAADFDGDGRTDIAGYDAKTGQWWVARSTGKEFQTRCWGQWPAGVAWQHVCVGDFNGDGRGDLAGWDPKTGQWWVALSTGNGFKCQPFATVDPADPWTEVAVGDVDGDGRDDLIGWSPKSGTCWVARSDGQHFTCQKWAHLPGAVEGLCVGDFDGDGHADVAWRDKKTGDLFVGLGRGTAFQVQRWGKWCPSERLTPLRAYRAWR